MFLALVNMFSVFECNTFLFLIDLIFHTLRNVFVFSECVVIVIFFGHYEICNSKARSAVSDTLNFFFTKYCVGVSSIKIKFQLKFNIYLTVFINFSSFNLNEAKQKSSNLSLFVLFDI